MISHQVHQILLLVYGSLLASPQLVLSSLFFLLYVVDNFPLKKQLSTEMNAFLILFRRSSDVVIEILVEDF